MKTMQCICIGSVLAIATTSARPAAENYLALWAMEEMIDNIESVDETLDPPSQDYMQLISAARNAMTNTCGENNNLWVSGGAGAYYVTVPEIPSLRMRLSTDLGIDLTDNGMALRDVFQTLNVCISLITPVETEPAQEE